MAFNLEEFRRILRAVLNDPGRADLLVEAVANVAASGEEAFQRAVAEELERAITEASAASRPFGRKLAGRTRIDILMLSPGGVVLKGRYHGKNFLATMLNCVVDEGFALGILSDPHFLPHFAAVRDGKKDTAWVDFEHGHIGFAAVHSDTTRAPHEKPDSLFVIVVTPERPDNVRRDPAPTVTPLALEQMCRRVSPAIAKSPREWMQATPDRRIIRLRDGRSMSTRWYGALDATPILDFGAIHLSTTANPWLANAAIEHGMALVVIERPGLGASDPVSTLTYDGVARDVAEIRRVLDLEDVLIIGAGTASSFALAVAHRLGDNAKAVALISPRVGLPSAHAPSALGRVLGALLDKPFGLDVLARLLRHLRIGGSAHSLVQSFAANNERDKKILHEMGMLNYLAMQTNDSIHQTVEGALAEFRLYQSGARFDPALISQPIRIWHGAENRSMLAGDIERAFARAQNVEIQLAAGAGVLIGPDEAASVIRWLANGWRAQAGSQLPERT